MDKLKASVSQGGKWFGLSNLVLKDMEDMGIWWSSMGFYEEGETLEVVNTFGDLQVLYLVDQVGDGLEIIRRGVEFWPEHAGSIAPEELAKWIKADMDYLKPVIIDNAARFLQEEDAQKMADYLGEHIPEDIEATVMLRAGVLHIVFVSGADANVYSVMRSRDGFVLFKEDEKVGETKTFPELVSEIVADWEGAQNLVASAKKAVLPLIYDWGRDRPDVTEFSEGTEAARSFSQSFLAEFYVHIKDLQGSKLTWNQTDSETILTLNAKFEGKPLVLDIRGYDRDARTNLFRVYDAKMQMGETEWEKEAVNDEGLRYWIALWLVSLKRGKAAAKEGEELSSREGQVKKNVEKVFADEGYDVDWEKAFKEEGDTLGSMRRLFFLLKEGESLLVYYIFQEFYEQDGSFLGAELRFEYPGISTYVLGSGEDKKKLKDAVVEFISVIEKRGLFKGASVLVVAPRKHEKEWQEAKEKHKKQTDKPEKDWTTKDWATVTIIMKNLLKGAKL